MIRKLIEMIVTAILVPIMAVLLVTAIFSVVGVLFGFEAHAPVCKDYYSNKMNRIERVVFVSAPIACKKDAQLLQPYLRQLGNWLTEVPND